MPDYRRNRVPGGTYFFTVHLRDRRSDLLVVEIAALRDSVRTELARRPFHIDAWVVLPDHMHCQWTLPEGDADYSRRMRDIKAGFTRRIARPAETTIGTLRQRESGIWQQRFWEHIDQGRAGLCGAYGLHPFQPGETRAGTGRSGVSLFVVSEVCRRGVVSDGLGWGRGDAIDGGERG
jgi:REP element-mobilizing transposase RayT